MHFELGCCSSTWSPSVTSFGNMGFSVNWLVWRSQKPPVIILWGMACAKVSREQYSLDFSNVRKSMQASSYDEEVAMCTSGALWLVGWHLPHCSILESVSYNPMIREYNRLKLINNMLYRITTFEDEERQQLVLIAAHTPTVLQTLYNDKGHPGIDRTLSLLRS
jgi:hypothetical protein